MIKRIWEMPNSNTFEMKTVKSILVKYVDRTKISIDPFAKNSAIATYTNDLNPKYKTDYHLEALDFLKLFESESIDVVLFDPPYSPRQIKECYEGIGLYKFNTKANFWSDCKNEIQRILKIDGKCISFGWNSNGIGKNRGFKILDIVLIAHDGNHNDTIIVIEQKELEQRKLF